MTIRSTLGSFARSWGRRPRAAATCRLSASRVPRANPMKKPVLPHEHRRRSRKIRPPKRIALNLETAFTLVTIAVQVVQLAIALRQFFHW